MHKRFVNHCTIDLKISPCGPILIKSGKEGADPTKPDMEFVETYHQGGRSIYGMVQFRRFLGNTGSPNQAIFDNGPAS